MSPFRHNVPLGFNERIRGTFFQKRTRTCFENDTKVKTGSGPFSSFFSCLKGLIRQSKPALEFLREESVSWSSIRKSSATQRNYIKKDSFV